MKLKLYESDIMKMVCECVKRLLKEEITAANAYAKFYDGKVPEDIYKAIMTGTDFMTPYHKIALSHYIAFNGNLPAGDINAIVSLWTNASKEARQYIIQFCKTYKQRFETNYPAFISFVKKTAKMKTHTEDSYSSRGYEELYRDENLLISCTKSYTSSCQMYGDSHWCTASDQFGELDGMSMFKMYTYDSQCCLIQFANLKDREKSFQLQTASNGRVLSMCIFTGQEKAEYEIIDMVSQLGLSFNELWGDYVIPNASRLVEETKDVLEDEFEYYERKKYDRTKTVIDGVVKKISSKSADEFAKQALYQMKAAGRNAYFDKKMSIRVYLFNKIGAGAELSKEACNIILLEYEPPEGTYEYRIFDTFFDDPEGFEYNHDGLSVFANRLIMFDNNGNILSSYVGYPVLAHDNILFMSDKPSDDLDSNVEISYIINAVNGSVMLKKVYAAYTPETSYDEIYERYGDEGYESIYSDESESMDYVLIYPTRNNYKDKNGIAINCETLEVKQLRP